MELVSWLADLTEYLHQSQLSIVTINQSELSIVTINQSEISIDQVPAQTQGQLLQGSHHGALVGHLQQAEVLQLD